MVPTIINTNETTIVAPTLVSVQPITNTQAEIIVKGGAEFGLDQWRLTMMDTSGKAISLSVGTASQLALFTLTPYRATGLMTGMTYRLRLDTRNAGGDSIRIERNYRHRVDGPRWVRLAHAPLVGGDFAGSALSTDNIPGSDPTFVSIWQLKSNNTWQTVTYFVGRDAWYATDLLSLDARHGLVRFQLQEAVGDVQSFVGLGFVTNELLPEQRLYQTDQYTSVGGRLILPVFAGPNGIVRWFATLTKAYQLVEGGPAQLWVRVGTWDQYRVADLPEPTGTLATFRIGTTGYVVNQLPGQSAHLWALDTQAEQWTRKADFPGPVRSRGIGFQASGNGYFGLGITPDAQTLRDVWQYDPGANQWYYLTDYPGAASTYLAVSELPGHTFLGWGYEQQPTATGAVRLIGCTDFWEFKAN